MESMTGFGICSKVIESHKITVLTKSVNNKGLSLVFRIPRETAHLEQALHRIAREMFSRGRIDVNISWKEIVQKPRLNRTSIWPGPT